MVAIASNRKRQVNISKLTPDFYYEVDAYRERLLSRGLMKTTLPQPEIEDLVSDTLMRAYERQETFKPDPALKREFALYRWLLRIFDNVLTDHYRKTQRQPKIVPYEHTNLDALVPPTNGLPTDIDRLIESEDTYRQIKLILEEALKLDPRFGNEIFSTIDERAKVNNGVKVGTRKSRLHRAIKKIREAIGNQTKEEV